MYRNLGQQVHARLQHPVRSSSSPQPWNEVTWSMQSARLSAAPRVSSGETSRKISQMTSAKTDDSHAHEIIHDYCLSHFYRGIEN